MNPNKKCIINFFAKGREDYQKGTERLITSANLVGFDGDIVVNSPDFAEDNIINNVIIKKGYPKSEKYGECKPHKEEPYQFKSFAFQQALEMGYEKILWCDSSVVLFKNPEHYFKLAKEVGLILFDNQGCAEGAYTSDDCLKQMGCSVEESNTFFQIDAAIMLLDFTYWKTRIFFNEYLRYCMDGVCLNGRSDSDRPEFTAHRHDQSIASYIAKKNYVNTVNLGGWLCWGDFMIENDKKYNPTFAKVGIYIPLKTIEESLKIESFTRT